MVHKHLRLFCLILSLLLLDGKFALRVEDIEARMRRPILQVDENYQDMLDMKKEISNLKEKLNNGQLEEMQTKIQEQAEVIQKLTVKIEAVREQTEANNREYDSTLIDVGSCMRSSGFNVIPVPDTSNSLLHQLTGLNNLIKLFVPRSCEEWRKIGFNVTGYYLIDPDGKGVGEEPVYAFCDMITGYSFIGHDHEGDQEVDLCAGPGCRSVDIRYNASRTQIEALMYNSLSCHQVVKIECYNSPFTISDTSFSWWEDRHGERHEYWSGSQYGERMCRCGFSQTCVVPSLSCNCDANLPNVWLHDEGTLSNITALPITKLSFGMESNLTDSKMKFRLGPLRCYGSKTPLFQESCDELRWSGISRSGYYFLGTPENLRLTYCAMKESLAEDEQRSASVSHQLVLDSLHHLPHQLSEVVGETDLLKTKFQELQVTVDTIRQPQNDKPVIFHSQASTHITSLGPVKFDTVLTDTHGGYSRDTGKYTIPRKGIYLISFYSEREDSSSDNAVHLKKKTIRILLLLLEKRKLTTPLSD